jgi:Fe-coproporphyrin III synthase
LISISRLLCDIKSPGDVLRYAKGSSEKSISAAPAPVVVWNCTGRCNLNCIHCYAAAGKYSSKPELDTHSGKRLINDLADFRVPVLLFSGGEPLLRKDLFDLAYFAKNKGITVALSTNGTLLDEDIAKELKRIGFSEVGISIDGSEAVNDRFRGKEGAYSAALEGIRHCVKEGLRVSLRFTITRFNYKEIPGIFSLAEREGINRLCFYHLAYAGRGSELVNDDITHNQMREAVDTICQHTERLHRSGQDKEVLTVANHADGAYLYLKLRKSDQERAQVVYDLLKRNGGNNSGIRISSIDPWGNVHPDQFWWHYSAGNILDQSFGKIWTNTADPLMHGLKDRKKLLKGRCSRCKFLEICNGNLRQRAEAVYGDIWAEDPACYLTDQEIGIE